MKLVSLNVWGGIQGQSLFDYIKSLAEETDIFCFQEVFSSFENAPKISTGAHMFLLSELQILLLNFEVRFEAKSVGYDFKTFGLDTTEYGICVFIKKCYKVQNYQSHNILNSQETPGTNAVEGIIKAQSLVVTSDHSKVKIINFYGISRPGSKEVPYNEVSDHLPMLLDFDINKT